MCGHEWSDDWPHWDELYEAQEFLIRYVKRHSLCNLVCKEKYGTIRYEWVFPPYQVQRVMTKYNLFRINFISSLYYKWMGYGQRCLHRGIQEAVKKFPNVRDEILDDFVGWE